MLTVCNGGQSLAEYRAQFSTWAILTSPLILGNDVRNLSVECAAIVLNKDVLAVNQDANVVRGSLVHQWPDAHWPPAQMPPPPLPPPSPPVTAGWAVESQGQPGAEEAPPILGTAVLEPCSSAKSSRWRWLNKSTHHMLALDGEDRCLTYGGFTEANMGVASCVGWDSPEVGGQSWELSPGSEGGTILRQTPVRSLLHQRTMSYGSWLFAHDHRAVHRISCCFRASQAGGGPTKCLAPMLQPSPSVCNASVDVPMEVCNCGGQADCQYHRHCPTAMQFVVRCAFVCAFECCYVHGHINLVPVNHRSVAVC